MKALPNAVSPETAVVVNDYPYGFRLRTKIRYWKETKKGFGQRFVSQTLNPKTGQWNKPKAGNYYPVVVMVQEEKADPNEGFVSYRVLGMWEKTSAIETLEKLYPEAFGEYEKAAVKYLKAADRAQKHIEFKVTPDDGTPRQTREEQAAIYDKAINYELRKDVDK